MIPDFDKAGLLPKGIHWALWDEIYQRFGTNAHRKNLLGGLRRALDAFVRASCRALYLDGSFVTSKEFPRDYDACWEMAGVKGADLDPVFLEFSNERALQKAKYLGEFFPALAPARLTPPLAVYLDFFQLDKATGDPKGIVGVNLTQFV